jgi:hypothetical protein
LIERCWIGGIGTGVNVVWGFFRFFIFFRFFLDRCQSSNHIKQRMNNTFSDIKVAAAVVPVGVGESWLMVPFSSGTVEV